MLELQEAEQLLEELVASKTFVDSSDWLRGDVP